MSGAVLVTIIGLIAIVFMVCFIVDAVLESEDTRRHRERGSTTWGPPLPRVYEEYAVEITDEPAPASAPHRERS
jgi:hypothetical protein